MAKSLTFYQKPKFLITMLFVVVGLMVGLIFVGKQISAQSSIYQDLQDRLQVSWQPYNPNQNSFSGKITTIDDDVANIGYVASVYSTAQCNGEASYVLRGVAAVGVAADLNLVVNQAADVKNLCLEVCSVFYNGQNAYPICNQQYTKDLVESSQALDSGVFKLTSPQVGSIFSAEFNRVAWEFKTTLATDQRIELAYVLSGSGMEFRQLAILPNNTDNYFFDVETLTNGRYQIRVSVLEPDLETISSSSLSPIFLVDNPAVSQSVSKGIITELNPAADTTTQNQRPNITGKFVMPQGETLDLSSFKISVNGFERSEFCRVDQLGFQCQQAPSLNGGLQYIQVTVRTTAQTQLATSWQFSVDAVVTSSGSFLGLKLGNINWVFVLVLLAVIGLIVFVIWYTVIRLRNRIVVVETYEDTDYQESNTYVVNDSVPSFETKNVVVERVSSSPTENVNKNVYLDPTDFGTYEDYLKAVSSKLAESEKTYVSFNMPGNNADTVTTTEVRAADIITVPDYSIDDSPISADSSDSKAGTNQTSSDSTPDWLKA